MHLLMNLASSHMSWKSVPRVSKKSKLTMEGVRSNVDARRG